VRPDLGSFCRLDELGLQVMGHRIEPSRAVLACRIVETDEFARWCRRCGCEAAPRDSVTRRLAHEPLGWRPTMLLITIRQLRGSALGFRNLTNYIARSLLETGGFRHRLHLGS
jgi:hypothetical protein